MNISSTPIKLLQHSLEQCPDYVFIVNGDDSIVYANQVVREDFSLPSSNLEINESTSARLFRFINCTDWHTYSNPPTHTSSHHKEILHYVTESKVKRTFLKSTCPLSFSEDKQTYRLVICVDITQTQSELDNLHTGIELLEERNDYLSALGKTATKMLKHDRLDKLLQHIADEMVEKTFADGAYLHMLHETEDYLHVVAATGPLSAELLGEKRIRGVGFSAKAWEKAALQFTHNYYEHEACVLKLDASMQAYAIPLLEGAEVLGVAFITCSDPNLDLSSHQNLLLKISEIASLAIATTKRFQTAALELKRTSALSQLSQCIFQDGDITKVLNEVCKACISEFDVSQASIFVANSEHQLGSGVTWSKSAANNFVSSELDTKTISESIAQWSFDHCQYAYIERGEEDERESKQIHRYRANNNIGCTVCQPIIVLGRAWGVFVVTRALDKRNFDENEINSFCSVTHQIAAATVRYELNEKILYQAHHDSLTGLSNRRKFEVDLREGLEQTQDGKSTLAVLFLDLDGFKAINDTLGHTTGDTLLKLVSERFSNRLKSGDTLARMGGDEFAVIVKGIHHRKEAFLVAERLAKSLNVPFDVEGSRLSIGTSTGLSFFPIDGSTPEELLQNADVAMYQAKNEGKGNIHCFNQNMAEQSRKHIQLEIDLKQAIEKQEFELWYQPQVVCRNGAVLSVEALIRWNHPTMGLVSPLEFIPVAEEAGLITAIGAWVLDEACAQIARWKRQGCDPIRVGVNISAPQFSLENFSEAVLTTLKNHEVDPHLLELEVTESIIMNDVASVVKRLNHLRSSGVRIAIDDFGTGYSSLSYLQDLPLDVLKIDRAFVSRLEDEHIKKSLVNTIILLATGLGLETVAEGVESEKQRESVLSLGCDVIQGYYYSPPVPADELLDVISKINHQGSTLQNVA